MKTAVFHENAVIQNALAGMRVGLPVFEAFDVSNIDIKRPETESHWQRGKR